MRSFTAAFLAALTIAALLTPVVRRLALHFGAVSDTGGRHVHGRQIPRLGGVAIAASTLAPLAVLFFIESSVADFVRMNSSRAIGILAGGVVLCAVGALDDVRPIPARHKLLVQVFVAAVAYTFGFQIQTVYLPYVGVVEMGIFGGLVTVIWIVGITNAINLIDGLDGLAAGVVFFAATTNFVVALVGADGPGQAMAALVMASLMGALVGFLFYNFNPARIFMGDSGSYFLGYVLATSSLLAPMQKTSTTVAILVPMVALGVPIFDTLFSMVRRYIERRPMFSPDRGHIHHRLLEKGITHRRAVLTLYCVSIVLAGSAIAIALGREWEAGLAILGASIVLVGLVRFVGYFQYAHAQLRRTERIYDEHVQRLRGVIPRALQLLQSAQCEEHVGKALAWIGERTQSAQIRLEDQDGQSRISWQPDAPAVSSRGQTQVALRSGPHGMQLIFAYASDVALSAQAEVLLQVLADQVHDRLLAIKSALVATAMAESDMEAPASTRTPSLSTG